MDVEAGPPLSKFGARPPTNPLIRGCSAAGGPCGGEAAHADADGGGSGGVGRACVEIDQ